MVIAIDGPAGAGKSSVARSVAKAMGFTYLDTGAMYRCVALMALRNPDRDVVALAQTVEIRLGESVRLDGVDVTEAIRTPEVSQRASEVAADSGVRAALVAKQQALLRFGDWVAEGRDIGTVVAPHAELKIFLTADPVERARRRAVELGAALEDVLAEQNERDERDRTRTDSPLTAAPDATLLDTTGLTPEQVVAEIARLARSRGAATAHGPDGPPRR